MSCASLPFARWPGPFDALTLALSLVPAAATEIRVYFKLTVRGLDYWRRARSRPSAGARVPERNGHTGCPETAVGPL